MKNKFRLNRSPSSLEYLGCCNIRKLSLLYYVLFLKNDFVNLILTLMMCLVWPKEMWTEEKYEKLKNEFRLNPVLSSFIDFRLFFHFIFFPKN
jgi:hypothetical protein